MIFTKQTIAYGVYFLTVVYVTYYIELFLSGTISVILLIASEEPPGDISVISKLLFSIGIPVFYAIVLFLLYYLYCQIVKSISIHLKLSIGVLFHIMIAVYLIWNIASVAF